MIGFGRCLSSRCRFHGGEPAEGPAGEGEYALETRLVRGLCAVGEEPHAFTEVFDPYVDPPEPVQSLLSDDLTSIATSLAHGLRHFRSGRVDEALWWWQFSYVASWGNEASSALRALQSVVSHDRLDAEFEGEQEQVAAVDEFLETVNP